MSSRFLFSRTMAMLAGGSLATQTFAQVNGGAGMIVYEPFASQVPTIGGFALVALALLLATVAFRRVRRPSGTGSRFFVLALAVSAVAAGGSGFQFLNDANARLAIVLNSVTGGVADIPDIETCHLVENGSPIAQQITQLLASPPWQLGPCPSNGGGFYPTCSDSPGTILNPGKVCEIFSRDSSSDR